MPDNAPVILAVDGPPGTGKTSLLARIAPAYGDACAFFTESNARLAGPLPAPEGGSAAGLSRWFLCHEQTRASQVAALSRDPLTRLILCDRNHLGVLAFCHAATAGDALPYDQALAWYQQDIAPNLPPELKSVILLVSPDVSLERRGGAAERPRWQQWFSRDLLGRLRDFYAGTAPGLCPSPPLVIDTDQLTPADVAQAVQPGADDESGRGLLIVEHLSDRCGWYPLNDPEPAKVTWAVLTGAGQAAGRLPAAPHPGAGRAARARPAPALPARHRPVPSPARAARAPRPVDPEILARVKSALERL